MRDKYSIRSSGLNVCVQPRRGFLINSIGANLSNTSLLWDRPGNLSGTIPDDLGEVGDASIASFDKLFSGGWFPMFPSAGLPGIIDGRTTLLHGEACRLPWNLIAADREHVKARLLLRLSPFVATRSVRVEGSCIRVHTRIENIGGLPASFTFGEHPCFSGALFGGGRVSLDATGAYVLGPALGLNGRLDPYQEFEWPYALAAGQLVDVGRIPLSGENLQDHVAIRLKSGLISLQSFDGLREVRLEFNIAEFPFVLLWLKFDPHEVPDSWNVLSVELMTSWGWSPTDAEATRTTRTLDPGDTAEFDVKMVVL